MCYWMSQDWTCFHGKRIRKRCHYISKLESPSNQKQKTDLLSFFVTYWWSIFWFVGFIYDWIENGILFILNQTTFLRGLSGKSEIIFFNLQIHFISERFYIYTLLDVHLILFNTTEILFYSPCNSIEIWKLSHPIRIGNSS